MEFLFLLQATIIIFSTLLAISKLKSRTTTNNEVKRLVEPPGAWPILGHLHLLGGKKTLPFRALGALADKHGPVFSVRLGRKLALVVSTREAVRECFTGANDHAFLGRPVTAALTHAAYGPALLGFTPYGPYWRELRKLVSVELLSARRIDLYSGLRVSELETSIKWLYSRCNNANVTSSNSSEAVVDMSEWINQLSLNSIMMMITKKRFNVIDVETDKDEFVSSRRFIEAIKKAMYFTGLILVSDFVRFGELLEFFQGNVRSMKTNAVELDKIMSHWLQDHVTRRRTKNSNNNNNNDDDDDDDGRGDDVIDTMLSMVDDDLGGSFHGYNNETVVKATTLNFVMAGLDTTTVAITWTLSLLLNHPQALNRAHEELDRHVGRDRWVQESDTKNLTYLLAVIKETLRLYPPGPLSVPRETIRDCTVSGYHVPKGTTLFVNVWKLHRDPNVWADPDRFEPERFLVAHSDVDVRGRQFEYVPFGSGRRVCPGISLAMKSLMLITARVLQGFNLSTVDNEPVEMSEGLGLSLPKMNPLKVLLTPRLGAQLYE